MRCPILYIFSELMRNSNVDYLHILMNLLSVWGWFVFTIVCLYYAFTVCKWQSLEASSRNNLKSTFLGKVSMRILFGWLGIMSLWKEFVLSMVFACRSLLFKTHSTGSRFYDRLATLYDLQRMVRVTDMKLNTNFICPPPVFLCTVRLLLLSVCAPRRVRNLVPFSILKWCIAVMEPYHL